MSMSIEELDATVRGEPVLEGEAYVSVPSRLSKPAAE